MIKAIQHAIYLGWFDEWLKLNYWHLLFRG
jgi:hypothetical protein